MSTGLAGHLMMAAAPSPPAAAVVQAPGPLDQLQPLVCHTHVPRAPAHIPGSPLKVCSVPPPERAQDLLFPLCPQAFAAHPVSVELASCVTVTRLHILLLHCPCGSSPPGPASCVFAPALARKQCLEIAADGRDLTCVARGGSRRATAVLSTHCPPTRGPL